jgi:hypothetical protein
MPATEPPGSPALAVLALALAAFLTACAPAAESGERSAGAPAGTAEATGRSLQSPPDLQPGEWWTVEVDPTLVGVVIPTTLVVTERSGDRAVIGIPPEEFSDDFLLVHIPPLGDLDLATFAWRVMWDDFEALRFPLELGRTWSADFHGRIVEAEVVRVEGNRAWVVMTGERERIELTYDADMGMITEFREDALSLNFRVTGHGFDYPGEVLSFSGIRLGMMESPPQGPAHHEMGSAAPTNVVEVDTQGSHGSLSLVLWNVGFQDEPGEYSITATAPDGTVFRKDFTPAPGEAPVQVQSFSHEAVNGTWEVDFHRDGPGGLLVELFTYDRVRVRPGVAAGGG